MSDFNVWKDESSRRQGQVDRTPTTWTLHTRSGLRISVTRHLYYPPDHWVLRVVPEVMRDVDLGALPIEAAKPRALGLVEGRLKMMAKELGEVSNA